MDRRCRRSILFAHSKWDRFFYISYSNSMMYYGMYSRLFEQKVTKESQILNFKWYLGKTSCLLLSLVSIDDNIITCRKLLNILFNFVKGARCKADRLLLWGRVFHFTCVLCFHQGPLSIIYVSFSTHCLTTNLPVGTIAAHQNTLFSVSYHSQCKLVFCPFWAHLDYSSQLAPSCV